MIDPKLFYSKFMVNYFDYKITYLQYALNNYKEFQPENLILQYSDKDFLLTIKSDIRQTLFQAIETVFEIIFALVPNDHGLIADQGILRTLSKGESHYNRIKQISENYKELDFLSENVILPDGESVPIIQYIFYFGLHKNENITEKINTSLEAIRRALFILAKEFSDRGEYNCYKHGLRIIPALNFFKLSRADNNEKIADWDLSDSMTYFKEFEKENTTQFITKVFDTERDLGLIRLCSDLLWNIIKIRNVAFNEAHKSDSKKSLIEVFFFDKDLINSANKTHALIQNLKFTTTFEED